MRKVERFCAQVLEKSLPGWFRGKGFHVLTSEYLKHWPGPNPEGERVVHAFTLHPIAFSDEHAMTLWFLLPDGIESPFPPERLQQAAEYIMERLERKAHREFKTGLLSIVLIEDQPTGNN